MKFRCERDVLAEGVNTAARAVSTRGGASPAHQGVRLELEGDQLTVTGTDLDLTISVNLAVSGAEPGVAVMPARITSEIVRAFGEGAVEVAAGDDEAQLTSGRSQFSVRTIPAEEYTQIAPPSGAAVTISSDSFSEALRQVVPAASSDDSRPIITGVLLAAEDGGLRLVATDSYRLAVRDLPGTTALEEGQSVLVPRRALSEVAKLLGDVDELNLRLGERDVTFEIGSVSLTTRLIEGEFPDYRGLIPESHPNRLSVARDDLLEAVRRVRIMASQEGTPLRLVQRPDSLELVAISQELGHAREEIDAKYEGAELTVAFNPEFLAVGIEACPGDELTLETVDELKPALLRSTESEHFLYLLMPVRVT